VKSPAVVEGGSASPSSTAEQLAGAVAKQADRRRLWQSQTGMEEGRRRWCRSRRRQRVAGEASDGALSRWAGGGDAHSRMGRSGAPAAGVGRDGARLGRGGAPAAGVGRDDTGVGTDGDGRRIGRRPEWGGWRVGGDGDLGEKIMKKENNNY
jgi:hypothetical protein